jgi:phospholipid-translocating ATPase
MLTNRFPCLDVELLNAIANNSPHIIKFLTVMTLCNTVIPIKRLDLHPTVSPHVLCSFLLSFILVLCATSSSPSGSVLYKAQSQDEDALVNAAANLHMVLVSKNGNNAGRFYGS